MLNFSHSTPPFFTIVLLLHILWLCVYFPTSIELQTHSFLGAFMLVCSVANDT